MNLQVFKNKDFGTVRVVEIENEPYFVGKDVAEILGYANSKDAISSHVDEEDKTIIQRSGNATFEIPNRGLIVINESGLYSLIISSKLPSAKKFKRWVTSEVLPSIRKHGGYVAGQENLSGDELLAKAVLFAQSKIEEMNKEITRMKPKEIFADAVSTSHTSILIGDLAKLISQNGVDIGQRRLFDWLRENGYLIKGGSSKNMPTQRAMDLGLFEVKESTIQNGDGSVRITRTTKTTGKGQIYFVNKFLRGVK